MNQQRVKKLPLQHWQPEFNLCINLHKRWKENIDSGVDLWPSHTCHTRLACTHTVIIKWNKNLKFIYVYECFACIYVCATYKYDTLGGPKGQPMLCNWSYRWPWAVTWEPRTKLELCARTSVFNHRGCSCLAPMPAPALGLQMSQASVHSFYQRIQTWATLPNEPRPLETNFLHGKDACYGKDAQNHGLSQVIFRTPSPWCGGPKQAKSTVHIPCHAVVCNRLSSAMGLPSRRGEEQSA